MKKMSCYGKIYFVKKYDFRDDMFKDLYASEIIAMIDLDVFGYDKFEWEFIECFFGETPFSMSVNKYDDVLGVERLQSTITDNLGSRLSYADSNTRLYECAKRIYKNNPSHRMKCLKSMIKAYKDDEDIYIVYYGY